MWRWWLMWLLCPTEAAGLTPVVTREGEDLVMKASNCTTRLVYWVVADDVVIRAGFG